MAQGHALDRALAGRAERQQVEQRPEHPRREREQRAGQHDRAAPEHLHDRAGLAALRRRQGVASFATSFGCSAIFRPSSAPRMPARDCTLPRLLTNCTSPSRFSTFSSRTSGAPRCPPRRAAFDDRKPGARRRREPGARIHAGRHRDAGAGKAEHQRVDLLAAQAAPALAHHVAHVAEHEQVAGQHAGRARDVLRLAGDEAAREACEPCSKAVAASCSADSIFAISAGAIATPRSAARSTKLRASSMSPAASASSISRAATAALKLLVEREFGEPHRIVRRRDRARRIDAAGQADGAAPARGTRQSRAKA